MNSPLILTLKLDDESFNFFDVLRKKYFPKKRNFLAAHVTLFHHLPDENLDIIKQNLRDICLETVELPLSFIHWRFLGKGSAMTIESNELLKLRNVLAKIWQENLTAQDRQKFQPHITIQNKVAPDEARKTFDILAANWQAKKGLAKGLTLWHYAGGPWRFEAEYLFSET